MFQIIPFDSKITTNAISVKAIMRIIPRLDIKGPNVVKGVQFEGLRVLGKPEDFAKYYYDSGADELIYMDVVASLYGRNGLLDIIEKTSREIFIPLTVGGGLRSIEDIRTVLRSGADKVAINTAAIQNPDLIHQASQTFGASTIIVSIEAIRKPNGKYEAYVDYGREATGVDACEWAIKAEKLGAGEILVTSIANEGTGSGFDTELMCRISKSVSIPVIGGGGAGCLQHVTEVINDGLVDGVSLASILHYNFIKQYSVSGSDYSNEGNVQYLTHQANTASLSRIHGATITELKQYLTRNGVACRQS